MTRVCLMTCPNPETAQSLAKQLLERRLVACVNLVPQVTSLYWWDGQIQEDSEILLIAKTVADRIEQLKMVLPELHPYDVPELVVLPVEEGLPAYLNWVKTEARG
ncbi:MAG: divalent-cation tolerance protein CutA [Candidatus Eremiobacteraeota bacterium]|nr:divalent-cation tolerance protein CutA [Candidatus Eremiobacteraeota bacterium]MCW5870669.1 divalent-cation tolerance protein CutA [Candidatus Eremiobacteraeota bacterium]